MFTKFTTFTGGRIATPLELFDLVAGNLDTMQVWNEAVKEFLIRERVFEALPVML